MAHGEVAIACHLTIEVDGEWAGNVKQCAGAAIYRANVCKSPRDPEIALLPQDKEKVFGFGEFLEHHQT